MAKRPPLTDVERQRRSRAKRRSTERTGRITPKANIAYEDILTDGLMKESYEVLVGLMRGSLDDRVRLRAATVIVKSLPTVRLALENTWLRRALLNETPDVRARIIESVRSQSGIAA